MSGRTHTILFVDDEVNILNALQRLFRKDGYRLLFTASAREALELFKANKISLVISDHRMPEMDGVEFLSKVKEASPDTVKFMLTGYADIKAVMSAINRGEVSRYITKPWNDDELRFAVREAIERHDLVAENRELLGITKAQNAELKDLNMNLEAKVAEKTRRIRENFFAFVRIFADLMELYDPYIGGHSKRVALMAKDLALRLGLAENEVDLVEAAALLHTAGLVGVPKSILDKSENTLTANEKAILRHSPVLTQSLFSSIDTLRQVGILIRCHMERFDGRGYPDGLKGEEIPQGARILSVCKHYDWIKHGREGNTVHGDPKDHIRKESGAHLDPEVVDAFIECLDSAGEEKKGAIVALAELKEGMVLAENLLTKNGRLLISKGTLLSLELIEKISYFNRLDPIADRVSIVQS